MDDCFIEASIHNRLTEASQKGDIDVLYEIIETDAKVLRHIDEIMFVDTPLHIAASVGQTCFAMEIMNLMPSFARKLNKSGLSPMHLAMQKGNLEVALLLLEADCDLVRVKGKEGLTPLHFAVKYGNIDLLAKLLVVCPKSIEDVTVNGETALHIAVKNSQLEAFEVLVLWLQRICHEDASKWEDNIPNRKDLQGKTILDIAASKLEEFMPLLAEINAKDSKGNHKRVTSSTVQNRRIFSCDPSRKTLTDYIRSKTSFDERFVVSITRYKMKISGNAYSGLLVVLGLLVTTTFPAIFSPPGSDKQGQDDDNNNNSNRIAVSNCTTYINTSAPAFFRTPVINTKTLLLLLIFNSGILDAAICLTCLLLPEGFLGSTLMISLSVLLSGYAISVQFISPVESMVGIVITSLLISMSTAVALVIWIHCSGRKKLRRLRYSSY